MTLRQRQLHTPKEMGWSIVGHLFQADSLLITTHGGFIDIGAKQSIPPRQGKAVIVVLFATIRTVVYQMHIRRDQDHPQDSIHGTRQANIAVVEESIAIQP